MIREIINFTENLVKDIPDIMQWNNQPSTGLHIFIDIDIDKDGKWGNSTPQYDKDYVYTKNISDCKRIKISDLLKYEEQGYRVGTTMNKVLDKKKQIFSCSPFIVSFKKKSLTNDKLEGLCGEKINNLLQGYFELARQICLSNDLDIQMSIAFEKICKDVLSKLNIFRLSDEQDLLKMMKDDEYVNIYLRNASIEQYKMAHDNYLKEKLFNCNDYNKEVDDKIYGLSGLLNGLNSKKPFLEHKTSSLYKGINGRISASDALSLNDFETLINNGTLPNPLPIVIDKREINKDIVKLFNIEQGSLSFREIVVRLFSNKKEISDYYLLNYTKRKTIQINDFDFVPLFRYYFDKDLEVENITMAGFMHDKVFEKDKDWNIHTIFDFERLIVREIFNNSFVKIKEDKYTTNYFGEIDPTYVSGGDAMYQLIMKYRKAFYDYIYKSKTKAINITMFNDMMYNSILSNIQKDEIKERCEWNNTIKKKINIWFSLYNLFNNNSNTKIMASQVTDLMSKMRKVVKGETTFETPEEFAFGAGQVVSYLIDRSVASNKTYAMLEPYLQKTKSNLLQDAIAQTIAVYKHDISTYRGNFQPLASNVLTYDGNVDVKPLLKYFLAGCFSPCVIYDKKEQTNNN